MLPYTCCAGNDISVFIIMDAAQRCSCVNGKCTEIHSDLLSRNSLCNRLAGGILKFLCIQPAIQDVFTFVNDCKAAESLLIMLELKCNTGNHDLQRGAGLSSRINTHNIQILGSTIRHTADSDRVGRSHRTRICVSRSGIHHHRCGLLLVIQGIVVIACCGSIKRHCSRFLVSTLCRTGTKGQFLASFTRILLDFYIIMIGGFIFGHDVTVTSRVIIKIRISLQNYRYVEFFRIVFFYIF